MIRVKLCGITRPEDAALAGEVGAWAIGLLFARESPRFVNAEQARRVIEALPPGILRVGVFLNQSLDVIRRVEEKVPLDMIQLHGHEKDDQCRGVGADRCIKAVVLPDGPSVERVLGYSSAYLLADRSRAGLGLTPESSLAQRKLAAELVKRRPRTLLAGGLDPENVEAAIALVRPWGVDVSSGLESEPGIKDPVKVRAFMAAVKRAEAASA